LDSWLRLRRIDVGWGGFGCWDWRVICEAVAGLRERTVKRVLTDRMDGISLTEVHLVGCHQAEFERELIVARVRFGIAAARARGKKLGRQPGQRPKSNRLAPKVLALIDQGRSYRLVGREVGSSKNTVASIVKRTRATLAGSLSHHLFTARSA